ncbi:serine/threonine protein kinase [Cryobacterium psychrophilum]|uniref:non-specific serine/threonine protein kinase n=2 Tax=Cryobacterium psychrophilum TaxID=41988 RepID=A0A4Y8KMT3_9MICO|nr:serine/threonine protein kinase [Cryobacterium psychrophilum]
MASVYQATDTSLGRTVAVKLFRSDSMDSAGPERQSGEISLLASLNHFALVTLFDAGTAQVNGSPRTFIVMEFVDGSDLRTRLLDGPLEPRDLADIGADLAEALHYVHALGIIHRDIKPANVLLTPSGFPGRAMHAKLADFGIARLLDETRLTATGATLGTASYLSPEQALGTALGPPTDVYSLGLVLLESLTGERAYPGTAIESAMARLQRQPQIPAGVSQGWADLLTAMTSREAADRPTASAAAVVLRTLVADSAPELVPTVPLLDDLAAETGLATALMAEPAHAATRLLPEQPAFVPQLAPEHDPASDDDNAPTALLPRGDRSEPSRAPRTKRPRRAPATSPRTARAIAVGAGIVLALVVLLVVLLNRPSTPEAAPPTYPAVDGPLGDHLQQLQESVTP